jgi:chromosome partitioning protein
MRRRYVGTRAATRSSVAVPPSTPAWQRGAVTACLHGDVQLWLHDSMHVIALASRKGGAGKTTLASHLGVEAEAAGGGPVALLDTDPQGGLAAWWNARPAETPRWIDPVDGLPAAVTAARAAGFGLLLIDTPPSVVETIASVIDVADLVVIPVRPSPNDLRAVGGTIELVRRARKRMVFVVNQATQRARITAQAAIALSQHGTVAPVMITARVDFAASMTGGSTAGELDPTCRSAAEMRELWTYLRKLLTEGTDNAATASRAA